MKWYLYRNEKGMEVKRESDAFEITLEKDGYKLIRVVDLEVSAKEKKAK